MTSHATSEYNGIKQNPFMVSDRTYSTDKPKNALPKASVTQKASVHQTDARISQSSMHKKLAFFILSGIAASISTAYTVKAFFDYDGENIIPLLGCGVATAISGTATACAVRQLFCNSDQNLLPNSSLEDNILKRPLPHPKKNLSEKDAKNDRENLHDDKSNSGIRHTQGSPNTSPNVTETIPVEILDKAHVEQFHPLKIVTTETIENLTDNSSTGSETVKNDSSRTTPSKAAGKPVTAQTNKTKQRAALNPANTSESPFPSTLPIFTNIDIGTFNNQELFPSTLPPVQARPVIDQALTSNDGKDSTENQDDSSTDDSDSPSTYLPPVWDESLFINNDLPPCDLPPKLGDHQAFMLGSNCLEFYSTEVDYFAKLELMAKLQVFFSKEKIQELCKEVSVYIPELALPLEVALKELLLTNNIEILKELSQKLQDDLNPSDQMLKMKVVHNEQDAATEAFALAIASQSGKFSKEVINATFRHVQAFYEISNIFKMISAKINDNKKLNPSGLVPQHPWNKYIQQFIRKNKDSISDSSFEGVFIHVVQRFPRIKLFSNDIKKYTEQFQTKQAQEFKNQELGKLVNEFEKAIENFVSKVNERMKDRDSLQEAKNTAQSIVKSEKSGYTLALDKNEKAPRVIAKKTSYKKMIVGVDLNDIHAVAQDHLTKGIEILNRRMGNLELSRYSSESDQEFNQRKRDIMTKDMTLLKDLKDALKSVSKQPEKSQKSISKENLKQLPSETKEVKSIEESLSEGERKTKKYLSPRSLVSGKK